MDTTLKPGWLQRQFDNVDKTIAQWPISKRIASCTAVKEVLSYSVNIIHILPVADNPGGYLAEVHFNGDSRQFRTDLHDSVEEAVKDATSWAIGEQQQT